MKRLTPKPWMFIEAFTALFAHNLYLQSLVQEAVDYASWAAYEAAEDA